MKSTDLLPPREKCPYQSCYCEENVYRMCELVPEEEKDACFAVFISNQPRLTPLFCQKSAGTREYVCWDYHVILVHSGAEREGAESTSQAAVYDLDTTLPFPCDFATYFRRTVRPLMPIDDKFRRLFRVIPLRRYLAEFSSDRSHMLKEDGSYMSPPPQWAAIAHPGNTNAIESFIEMEGEIAGSEVLTEAAMAARFGAELEEAERLVSEIEHPRKPVESC